LSTPRDTLRVFAASSLKDAFDDVAREFETLHSHANIEFHFAGSHILRTQIENGAKADLFAPASLTEIRVLEEKMGPLASKVFASNELEWILGSQSQSEELTIADLPSWGKIVMGTPYSPIGHYSREFLSLASDRFGSEWKKAVELAVVSEESNARLLRAKVVMGEADAALVYRSDRVGFEGVKGVRIPFELQPTIRYAIASLPGSDGKEMRDLFLDFLMSPQGQELLRQRGFGAGAEGEPSP
jgi:molybdate transport system substrate-binding protein